MSVGHTLRVGTASLLKRADFPSSHLRKEVYSSDKKLESTRRLACSCGDSSSSEPGCSWIQTLMIVNARMYGLREESVKFMPNVLGSGKEVLQHWTQVEDAELIGCALRIRSQCPVGALSCPEHVWDNCWAPQISWALVCGHTFSLDLKTCLSLSLTTILLGSSNLGISSSQQSPFLPSTEQSSSL